MTQKLQIFGFKAEFFTDKNVHGLLNAFLASQCCFLKSYFWYNHMIQAEADRKIHVHWGGEGGKAMTSELGTVLF
jgi:hypothetical protein